MAIIQIRKQTVRHIAHSPYIVVAVAVAVITVSMHTNSKQLTNSNTNLEMKLMSYALTETHVELHGVSRQLAPKFTSSATIPIGQSKWCKKVLVTNFSVFYFFLIFSSQFPK